MSISYDYTSREIGKIVNDRKNKPDDQSNSNGGWGCLIADRFWKSLFEKWYHIQMMIENAWAGEMILLNNYLYLVSGAR